MTQQDDEREDGQPVLSRRSLLKGVGLVGAAATTGGTAAFALTAPAVAAETAAVTTNAVMPRIEALETLTALQSDALEAMVARIIPTDEKGPGAAEARAAYYIDRGLGGPLASSRAAYAAGLAALDAYAEETKGAVFAALSAADQDAVLTAMEKNEATGFVPNSSSFFNLVRTHTIQGTFCDPYHGGNRDFVGWDMIAYPGVRMTVTEDEQRMSPKPEPVRRSAYEETMFTAQGTHNGNHPR